MSETLSVEPRRTSPLDAGSHRELPVLFHLMDVSRSKSPPPVSIPTSAMETVIPPGVVEAEIPVSVPPATETRPIAVVEESLVGGASAAPTTGVSAAESIDTPTTVGGSSSSTIVDQDAAAKAPFGEVEEGVPANAKLAAATPRRDTARHVAKVKPRAGNEWFASQGRYIAIGFVLALIGTIYIARANRSTVPAAGVQPHAHPGEAGQQVAAVDTEPATVVGESQDKPPSESTAGKTGESSPAKLADGAAAAETPQTDLHPPTIPQLVREPTSGTRPENNALFPWPDQPADHRLATRPDAPTAAPAAAPQTQYPVTAVSTPAAPTYPQTATPNANFTAPTGPGSGSVPDYRSPYLPVAPANSQPPVPDQSFVPPTGGPGSTYLPSDNTARGYRYERTGSGPY